VLKNNLKSDSVKNVDNETDAVTYPY